MDKNLTKILISLKTFKGSQGEFSLLDFFSNEEIIGLAYHINNNIDKEDKYYSEKFNEIFKVPKETNNIVKSFKHSTLRFSLILEETLELGMAYELTREKIYNIFISCLNKVFNNYKNKTNEKNLIEIFDAQIDLLVVVYGAMYVNNFIDISNEGMKEVFKSNVSKICKDIEEVKETILEYEKKGIKCKTLPLEEGYIVLNKETNKVLKSINYIEPNIKDILFKNSKL